METFHQDFATEINTAQQLFLNFTTLEETTIKSGDLSCIRNTLPQLYPAQQKDVQKAEKRFEKGKGILFTNGTGTGKTFVGLGLIKRFTLAKKSNILIIVPTDKKAKDWIKEGQCLDLYLYQLHSCTDFSQGIVITTYANFYQNEHLVYVHYDLIVYDESHYLLQNAQGKFTEALSKHKQLAKLPSTFEHLYRTTIRKQAEYDNPSTNTVLVDEKKFKELYTIALEEYLAKTKIIFLSATPFAYHKSLLIGDGTLWEIDEVASLKDPTSYGYNTPGPYDTFFTTNFGYTMKYNKLTKPEAGVDVGLLERQFYEKYHKLGVISGRQISVAYDYSREFIAINSTIGNAIDTGKELFHTREFSDKYPCLYKYAHRKFSYLYTNQLLECIKAKEVINRVQQHIELKRKVVIFHHYNHSLPSHPFNFEASKLLKGEEEFKDYDQLYKDIEQFKHDYPELLNLDLEGLDNTRKTLKQAFPNILEFNGTISKKKRAANLENFTDNHSNHPILLVQTKAGKEGISLHDTIGNSPRVLITLGLPIAPTDAIQIEGRIYRIGLQSNAIYEYITLQTNFEKIAFAEKVAIRSRTAENLAMGEKARNLELVFKEGYLNANDHPPSLLQGTGSKEADRQFEEITPFQKAMTYYYASIKKTSRNKSREGKDYYATPEPLGYKMVEWLKPSSRDRLLEPSAGHGAIARFFPNTTENTFIEPSYQLTAKLGLHAKGEIKQIRFEELNRWNKYEGIVMNPPFGSQGKLALEHLEKAVVHLNKHVTSRIVAIVPCGPAFEKRFQAFMEKKENSTLFLSCQILLPKVVFKRTGTSVLTKILILETNSLQTVSNSYIDLTYIQDINDFFKTIETLEF